MQKKMVWFLFSSNFKTITNQWRFRTINLRLINGEVKTYSFLYSISRFGQVTHPNRPVKLTVPVIKAVGLSEDKNSFPQTALMRGCVENISCVSKREFFRHLKNKQRWTSSQNFAEVSHRPRVVSALPVPKSRLTTKFHGKLVKIYKKLAGI